MREDEKVVVLSQEGMPIRAYLVKATTPGAIEEMCGTIQAERRQALKHAFCTLHPARTIDSVGLEDIPNITTEVVLLKDYP